MQEQGLWSQSAKVQIWAQPPAGCMTLNKLLNLPVPQFSHLQNGNAHTTNLIKSLWELNELKFVKALLAHTKHYLSNKLDQQ